MTTYTNPAIVNSLGKAVNMNTSIFLEHVNISINLYENRVEGKGTYIFRNPETNPIPIDLFFDPSYYPKKCLIEIENEKIVTEDFLLNTSYYFNHRFASSDYWGAKEYPFIYNVIAFNTTIKPLKTITINVSWICDAKYSSRDKLNVPLFFEPFYEYDQNSWSNSYLVISNSSWPKPISTFRIQFISHSSKFNDPMIGMLGITPNSWNGIIGSYANEEGKDINRVDKEYIEKVDLSFNKNIDGNSVVTISMNNWTEYDAIIHYKGAGEYKPVMKLNPKFVLFISSILFVIIVIIIFVIRRHRRKPTRAGVS